MRRDIVLRWLFWAWVQETQDRRIGTAIRRLNVRNVNEAIGSYNGMSTLGERNQRGLTVLALLIQAFSE